jgi:hypothetical protein
MGQTHSKLNEIALALLVVILALALLAYFFWDLGRSPI